MPQVHVRYGAAALEQQMVDFYQAISFILVSRVPGVSLLHLQTKTEKLSLKLELKHTSPSNFAFHPGDFQQIVRNLAHCSAPFSYLDDATICATDPAGNSVTISSTPLFDVPYTNPKLLLPKNILPPKSPVLENLKVKKIGILTSGGDSSGMNAAVRSITRYAIHKNCEPYAIFDGYDGLVEGGSKIKKFDWEDVRGLLSVGGTVIGTARCIPFKSREGRLQAAFNLIKNGIDALVVIGGDGSLTGANLLRSEWKGLLDELIQKGLVLENECIGLRNNLTIVGLVGSIDNDMSLTDITIGAYSSLHRICESLDSLTSTALSHQRAFVVEVMGRHCGWLALMAAIAVGADWVFLPERPPPANLENTTTDWETEMCAGLLQQRNLGSRKTLVIVCEGAIDRQLKSIKSEYIKQVIESRLGLDTRVTTLGHVQRGGTPCAFDRVLATLQGVEAVEAVLRSTPDTPALMVGISQNKIINIPLMEAVERAISEKNFKHAMELRDPDFNAAYDAYMETTLRANVFDLQPKEGALRIGIMHVGAPAGGMNAATRIAGRLCINRGYTPVGIRNGFSGLIKNEVSSLSWEELSGIQVKGGSDLGTNRDHPRPLVDPHSSAQQIHTDGEIKLIDLGQIAYQFQKHGINSLLIIGGFEGFTSLLSLTRARKMFPAFCIPMCCLPATVSNNVPGTEHSIGSDTAVNAIVESCDRIKLSANASRNRVFVVEVQGGNCGYLAVVGGLACGATTAYIPEIGINLSTLQADVGHLCRRYQEEKDKSIPPEGRVVLRTEGTSKGAYTTDVISNILKAEGKGLFDSRTAVFGHLQQGGIPSPLDRIRATRMAVSCVNWLENAVSIACGGEDIGGGKRRRTGFGMPVYTERDEDSCVIGIKGAHMVFTPVEEVVKGADMKNRRDLAPWWNDMEKLIHILAKFYC